MTETRPKIVVLDGFALNPGDISWEPIAALGTCTIYDRTPESEIVTRARGASTVLTNKTPLRAATLAALNAQYIGVLATGYDVVDVAQAAHQGIVVTNVPEYGTNSVAQMTFALLLELTNRVGLHADAVARGEWSQSPDWSFWRVSTMELAGKTMGIVGYGRIGRRVAEMARVFEMEVIVTGKERPTNLEPNIRWGTLADVLAAADIVSLHCPLRPETRGIINAASLAQMKHEALLINTARGGLMVEEDVAAALNSGHIAGAALDVLTTEPPQSSPLLAARNNVITPHIAWATREARLRLLQTAADNLKMWLSGHPQNVVS